MSSVKLQAPPADAGIALRQSFIEVCENSFFAFVDQCAPERFAELVDKIMAEQAAATDAVKKSRWIKASVGFTGSFGGAIEVVLPEPLATTLVAALLGEEIECEMPEHWVFDGIGEFANMICGAWLTTLCNSQAFELRPPTVTRMAPNWTLASDAAGDDDRSHRVAVNDFPVRVRFRALGD